MSFNDWTMQTKPVIPVIVLERLDDAIPLATALLEGGVNLMEFTLRTPIGLDCISIVKEQLPEAIVGAGTVCSEQEMQWALDAGAEFAISPGISRALCQSAHSLGLAYAPGVMTPTDIILGKEFNLPLMKFFPANLAGGIPMLNAFSGPFPDVRFCPTGGINESNAHEFLALTNVMAVGGSWLSDKELIENKQWREITRLAKLI